MLRRLILLLGLVAFVYFAVTVPIGKHTLWGHLVRIAGTPEAKDFATGAKDAAREAADRAKKELKEAMPSGPSEPPRR